MIEGYLNQTVVRNPQTDYDAYGKATFGAGESLYARIQGKQRRAMNDAGTEFVTDAEMWTDPDQDLALDDVIVFDSIRYKVVRIDTKNGLTGSPVFKKALLVKTKENG